MVPPISARGSAASTRRIPVASSRRASTAVSRPRLSRRNSAVPSAFRCVGPELRVLRAEACPVRPAPVRHMAQYVERAILAVFRGEVGAVVIVYDKRREATVFFDQRQLAGGDTQRVEVKVLGVASVHMGPTRACAREAETIAPAHSLRTASRPTSGRRRRQARIAARLKPRDPERPADGGLQPDRNGLDLGFTRFLLDFSDIRLTGARIGAGGPGTPKMCGGLPADP